MEKQNQRLIDESLIPKPDRSALDRKIAAAHETLNRLDKDALAQMLARMRANRVNPSK